MKHVELVSELILAAHAEDVSNKRAALDKIIEGDTISGKQLSRARRLAGTSITRIRRAFPKLKSTRFAKISDSYSLAVLFQKFEREGLILTNARRNALAQDLLTELSDGVDALRLQVKQAKGIKRGQELYREYWSTVQEGTDEITNRRNREKILRGLLQSLFERKDRLRSFSPEQRRIIWNRNDEPRCRTCRKKLTWEDFTIDHIRPHSKGGETKLRNAALMCRKHNSSKGGR